MIHIMYFNFSPLQFRDIAGQERFSSMTRAYYKGAVGAVVMFDQVGTNNFY